MAVNFPFPTNLLPPKLRTVTTDMKDYLNENPNCLSGLIYDNDKIQNFVDQVKTAIADCDITNTPNNIDTIETAAHNRIFQVLHDSIININVFKMGSVQYKTNIGKFIIILYAAIFNVTKWMNAAAAAKAAATAAVVDARGLREPHSTTAVKNDAVESLQILITRYDHVNAIKDEYGDEVDLAFCQTVYATVLEKVESNINNGGNIYIQISQKITDGLAKTVIEVVNSLIEYISGGTISEDFTVIVTRYQSTLYSIIHFLADDAAETTFVTLAGVDRANLNQANTNTIKEACLDSYKKAFASIESNKLAEKINEMIKLKLINYYDDAAANNKERIHNHITNFENVESFEFDVGVKYKPIKPQKIDTSKISTTLALTKVLDPTKEMYFDIFNNPSNLDTKTRTEDPLKNIRAIYNDYQIFGMPVKFVIPLEYGEATKWLNLHTKTTLSGGPSSTAKTTVVGGSTKKRQNRKRGKTQRKK